MFVLKNTLQKLVIVEYPKHPINKRWTENKYLNHSRYLKFYNKESVGEQSLSPMTTYNKKKIYHRIQINGINFRMHHTTPEEIRPFDKQKK